MHASSPEGGATTRPRVTGTSRLDRNGGRRLYLLMAAPITIYVLVVFVWPLVYGVGISLFHYQLTDPTRPHLRGSGQLRQGVLRLQQSDLAHQHARVRDRRGQRRDALGMGLALLLWRDTRLNQVASALLLIPIALTPLVAGLVWRAILNPDFGMVGYYLTTLGVRRGLTAQPETAMLSVILVDAWQWTPLVMLILLAGLKTLPMQPFEAARVDGGSSWAIFRNLTLPMLAPTILLALLFRTMDAFRVFDAIFAMTQGGPGLSTTVLNFYVYKQGLVFFDMGFAASLSTILLVVIGAFSLVYIRLIGRQERERARPRTVQGRGTRIMG